MKKIIAISLSLLVLCGPLCACGSSEALPSGTTPSANAQSAVTENAPVSAETENTAEQSVDAENTDAAAPEAADLAEYGVLGQFLDPLDYEVDLSSSSYIDWSEVDGKEFFIDSLADEVTVDGIVFTLGMSYQDILDKRLEPYYDSPVSFMSQYGSQYECIVAMKLPCGGGIEFDLAYSAEKEFENLEEAEEPVLASGTVIGFGFSDIEGFDFEYSGISCASSLSDVIGVMGKPTYAREKDDFICLTYYFPGYDKSAEFEFSGDSFTVTGFDLEQDNWW